MKQVTKGLTVVKDLPVELKGRHENNENGFWLWASKEIVDSTGDIIRIDGIDLSKYHDPQNGTHLKILAQHIKVLPNGMAPVVAIVKDYTKTTVPFRGKMVKALALYCEWLRNAEGKLLPLSKHYKEMVDAGGIDSGSVGVILEEYGQLKETGGLDITKSSLFETSLVTIPANGSATLVRSKLADLGFELDDEAEQENEFLKMLDNNVETPEEAAERTDSFVRTDHADGSEWVSKAAHDEIVANVIKASQPHNAAQSIEGLKLLLTEQLAPLAKSIGDMADRLDALESAVVLTQARKSQGEADHTAETKKSLELVSRKLAELQKFAGK